MRRICVLLVILLSVSFVQAQEGEPTVNINALTIATGSISDFMSSNYGNEDSCINLSAVAEAEEAEELDTSPSFSCLLEAVLEADLADTLAGEGPFVVFAPSNDSFQAFLNDNEVTNTYSDLIADTDMLREILLYHVVPMDMALSDMYFSANNDSQEQLELETVQGGVLTLTFPRSLDDNEEGVVSIGDGMNPFAYVNGSSIDLANGYIIPINNVLVPPM